MYTEIILKKFAVLALFMAHISAGSASLWNLYQPELPEQLKH